MSFLSFSGRATRNEYRRYALIPFLVVPGVGAIIFVPVAILVFNWWTPLAVASLFGVTVLIQMAASPLWLGITVRRLHDTGRSARWLLPYSVISVGWVLIVVGFLATDQLILRFLVDLWGIIWAFVSWAFIIKLLMLCSSLGTIGSNQYGPQSGVLEESGGEDAELTPPKSTRIIKPLVRVLGFSVFGLFAVVAVMALLAVVIVIGLATGQFIFIEGPGVASEYECGKTEHGTSSRLLRDDCEALLSAKNRLEGTGYLNWDWGASISSWDGITTGRTPSRVTKIELNNKGLTGNIPPILGALFELTHLDLSDNSLTGQFPWDIGSLANLEVLKLSGNSLTGCIPLALRDVATNDLAHLNLPYCPPPPPDALAAGTAGETSVPLSWAAPANTSKFRVEYRAGTANSWTVDDESIPARSHTVEGLQCETEYRFRVSAYGSGTTYAAAWSNSSSALTASTGECVPRK